jgi:oligopeptidase A
VNATDNPLLDFSGLPRFDAIRAEHVTPAVLSLLADARATAETVATDPRPATWDNVVVPLDDALDRLDRAWGAVAHLNAVVNSPELRETYNANLPRLTDFHTDLAQDLRLYDRYRVLAAAPGFATCDPAQRRSIENELRDFRLAGAELPDDRKAQFKEIQEELSALSSKFEDNVLDATNDWALFVDSEVDLAGVPDDVLRAARAEAGAAGRSGYKLTLRMPSYLPVMQYASNRALRATLHRAYSTRASELGARPEWDNTPVIQRILELRREEAKLLSYANYAEVSLVPKMAKSSAEVIEFLHEMNRKARPFALRDIAELAEFARDTLGIVTLEAHDLAFASERLKEHRYAFSDQEVRQYFPEHRVLRGLFRVAETLYGITIREATTATWHPDVRFFELRDAAGTPFGEFYLDLHARSGKQGGAWMDSAIDRRRVGARVQHPVAYLTCNLSAPEPGRPATFTHDEVTTIFHEFGHGLHQLLTRVDVAGVSGIHGVEWDAVELPSQFMENFCWEWDVLSEMSEHAVTGAPLPRALFDKMVAAKNFQSGLTTVRHLEYGLFDMLLHSTFDPAGAASPRDVEAAVRREIAVAPRATYDRFMHSFRHIFAGAYAAGYYSYKWAEVLSADAFSLFEEAGVLSPVAGSRFRDEVLARGGSRPALESFVAFRGRAPQIDALLRHNGMIATA